MSKQNPRRRSPRAIGPAVLGAVCAGGAVAWVLGAVLSLLPAPPETGASAAGALDPVSEATREEPEAPTGRLQVQLSVEERAYVQNLTCTGDASEDPGVCADLALVQAETAGGEGIGLFDEVPEGAVCEEEHEYGAGRARISGEWNGQEIDTEVTRTDSCEEVRWQRLRPLTDAVAAEPVP